MLQTKSNLSQSYNPKGEELPDCPNGLYSCSNRACTILEIEGKGGGCDLQPQPALSFSDTRGLVKPSAHISQVLKSPQQFDWPGLVSRPSPTVSSLSQPSSLESLLFGHFVRCSPSSLTWSLVYPRLPSLDVLSSLVVFMRSSGSQPSMPVLNQSPPQNFSKALKLTVYSIADRHRDDFMCFVPKLVIVNLTGCRIIYKTHLWACLWECFQEDLSEEGRPTWMWAALSSELELILKRIQGTSEMGQQAMCFLPRLASWFWCPDPTRQKEKVASTRCLLTVVASQSTREGPCDSMSCGTHSNRERRFDLFSSKAQASATQDYTLG